MNINKNLFLLITLLLLIVSMIYIFNKPKLATDNVIGDRTEAVKLEESPLSDQAEYPSPVQQLQQVVTYGLVNAEAPELPLLKGELQQFSDQNIKENYPLPKDLKQLKQQLNELILISEVQ